MPGFNALQGEGTLGLTLGVGVGREVMPIDEINILSKLFFYFRPRKQTLCVCPPLMSQMLQEKGTSPLKLSEQPPPDWTLSPRPSFRAWVLKLQELVPLNSCLRKSKNEQQLGFRFQLALLGCCS